MPLSSAQIGAIGEHLLVNAVMMASDGRLSPFQPHADDAGRDVLFHDKKTDNSVAIQLKCRTVSIRKRNSEERGNVVHFQIRKTTFNDARRGYLVAALFEEELTRFVSNMVHTDDAAARGRQGRLRQLVIRPSKAADSADRYAPYRCYSGRAGTTHHLRL
ncbi:hypothetical protein [Paraburkholderia sp. BL25I1N1]|uniref:hypothetical protein n=1 Tax=Paraburkholderia sp. BL25I1N1 TaxID=1938804 RepID=UPI000D06BE9D|nr:hypothetical protein [Paraburkholderia sp. BL25I1N1]PRY04693.1 hypothetical protein B0G73_1118 [Paraburkholderia sp. BL25I1N1]